MTSRGNLTLSFVQIPPPGWVRAIIFLPLVKARHTFSKTPYTWLWHVFGLTQNLLCVKALWVSAHYIILSGQAGPEAISRREAQVFLTLRNPIFLNRHKKYGGGKVGGRNLWYVKQTHRSNQGHKYSARLNHGCDAFLHLSYRRKVKLPTFLPPINSLCVAAGGHTHCQPTT